jgi:ketosteroid isomerase-like protein
MGIDQKQKIQELFNSFDGKDLSMLNLYYSNEVIFIDPVVNIQGLDNMKSYFLSAYENVKNIKFEFNDILNTESKYTAIWTMHLQARGINGGAPIVVHGVSILHFNDQGLITYHRDYLDLGAMVYERLPIIGILIRKIKKILSHHFQEAK